MSEKIPQSQELNVVKPETKKFGRISVECALNREKAPNPDNYKDNVRFATGERMEEDLAAAFRMHAPILIEGDTGIGKSTTVGRMCAELGYELYPLMCSRSTKEGDFMGKYVPNPDKKTELDPEGIFALGQATEAIIPEEGKVKVLFIDEPNTLDPQVATRIHDILDMYEKGGDVILRENAGRRITIDCNKLQIVACMNEPGGKHSHAEELSAALMRRFEGNYKKYPERLPAEELKLIAKQIFQKDSLLGELPGISDDGELVNHIVDFHQRMQIKLESKIKSKQKQNFSYSDLQMMRRLREAMVVWYEALDNNIVEATREALRRCYGDALADPIDRAQIEEEIRNIDYKPPQDNRRKGLEREKKPEAGASEEEIDAKRKAEEILARSAEELAPLKDFVEKKKKELGIESMESAESILKIDRSADILKFTGWSGASIEDKDTDTRSTALTEIDLSKLKLNTSWLPKGESSINGEKRLEALKASGNIRLDAQILITLIKLPTEELNKKMEIIATANGIKIDDLKKKYIHFDGTILRDSVGHRHALYLSWFGSKWNWNRNPLSGDWNERNPSLVLAS